MSILTRQNQSTVIQHIREFDWLIILPFFLIDYYSSRQKKK